MSYNSGSNHARNFKSDFEITCPITDTDIVLHSVQLLLLIKYRYLCYSSSSFKGQPLLLRTKNYNDPNNNLLIMKQN